jgi:hypothetical protein
VILERLPPTLVAAMLAEQANEAANKDLKRFQKHNSRQMTDLEALNTFNRLMRRSDPIIQVLHIQYFQNISFIEKTS